MANSTLTPLEREVRRILVATRGRAGANQIADQLGIHRVTVWKAKRAIQEKKPLPGYEARLENEVADALAWFRQMEDSLLDELESNEAEIAARSGKDSQVGFLSVRVGLYSQLRQARQDRIKFLIDIGDIRKVPDEVTLRNLDVSGAEGEELDKEIKTLEGLIADARRVAENTA